MGQQEISSITACSKASHSVGGADANGDVLYESRYGGADKNGLTIAIAAGATGGGNENRPLAVVRSGVDVVVTLGTDGSGNTIFPTATEMESLFTADDALSKFMTATAQGTGASVAGQVTQTNLAGGADDGDRVKFTGPPVMVRYVAGSEAL